MIDITKKYCTRDGREVRIYATDGSNGHQVHGAIYEGKASGWIHRVWFKDGRMNGVSQSDADLIEVRPRIKREVWVNVYPNGTQSFGEKRFADEHAKDHRIACVKLTIDVEEGEGL